MRIELLYHPGCPHAAAARETLRRVLDGQEDAPAVAEIDLTDARTPAHLRVWGSPTILVDGADVAGGAPSGPSCRLYPGSEAPGAPPAALIEAALRRAARAGSPPTSSPATSA